MEQERVETFIGGIGGQGVVYSANLIARAGLIRHKFASSMAHYGPESRGSVTTSEVVISNLDSANQIDYPVVENADVLIVMHQKAYTDCSVKYKSISQYIIYDSTLVNINPELQIANCKFRGVPASQLAKDKLDNIMMANIILTAAFAEITGVITRDDLEQALKEIVSANDFALNQAALKIGFAIK